MTDIELRANAMLAELQALLNGATQRCATLAADLAVTKKALEDEKLKKEVNPCPQ
jgi:hypothetical protein